MTDTDTDGDSDHNPLLANMAKRHVSVEDQAAVLRKTLLQVFGGVAFPKHRKCFRGFQITSESATSHQKARAFTSQLEYFQALGKQCQSERC